MEPLLHEHLLATPVHGRYLVDAPADPAAGLLVGFHGYGENAESHLESLRQIPGSSRWVRCAVQALHPFYNAKTGEVIASWMTRLDRELAIVDNVRYVAAVVAELRSDFGALLPLVYAGFSQGVAMAYRAAAKSGHDCRGLIALAGDVPPELRETELIGFPRVLLGRGKRDPWYGEERMEQDLEILAEKGIEVQPLIFEGGHEWAQEFLRAAGRILEELSHPGGEIRSAGP